MMRFFRRTYKHRCPDGTVKTLHRNLDDAFPLYVPGIQTKMSADLGALAGTPGLTVAGDYQNQLQGVLYSLSDRNESLMMSFRAVYAMYQTDPCTNQASFDRQVEAIIDGVQRLTELQFKVRSIILLIQAGTPDARELTTLFHNVVMQASGPIVVRAATSEMERARGDAHRWIDPTETIQ
jgi:hypothetical protein